VNVHLKIRMMTHLRKQNSLIILIFLGLIFLMSCSEQSYFMQSHKFEDGIWNIEEVAEFQLDIQQKNQIYYLFFDIKSSENYSTSNLWLYAEVLAPDGTLQTDTLEFDMAEPSGKWLGNHEGQTVTTTLLYKREVAFPDIGVYKFRIRQGMRPEHTPQISEFTLRTEMLSKK